MPGMDADQPTHRDRYHVSGNIEAEYVDAEKLVLVNKLGISELALLQEHEERGLVEAYEKLLSEVTQDTPLSCDLLRYIHHAIFGELYERAGRWRTVWIQKTDTTWPPPDFLDRAMEALERDVLARHRAQSLRDDEAFCRAAGEIQGEFLVSAAWAFSGRGSDCRTTARSNFCESTPWKPSVVRKSRSSG